MEASIQQDAERGAHLMRQTVLLALEGMCPCYFGGPYLLTEMKDKPDHPGAVFMVYQANPGGSFWMVDIGTPPAINERFFCPAKEAWMQEKGEKVFVLVLMMNGVPDRDRDLFTTMLRQTFDVK